ncbi:cellulose binding domain-containing protein [Paractinoplanes atraurantiacus]|uniref:Cellulose binding domain-containing protein n=1 Tax=Paractinoplanes atraurantiacus TaxID=1036182 RepID=A0A285H2U4_9ACTN|nr:cellulose binding domain-containing protein [Actinoplanes atraurantiacus]SNY28801.1 Cellulose binding domain-containing protein [Actinoplanes atraurantiacus]
MPSKHSVRLFGPARFVLSFGVAILVLLVVWIAVRAVGPAEAARQPSVTLPSMPQVPLVVSDSPVPLTAAPKSTSPAPSRSASRSPSASPSPSRSATTPPPSTSSSPQPEKSTTKPTTKPATTVPTTAPTSAKPQSNFEAQLSVTASWDQGYVAFVRVENSGDATAQWRVTVSHSGLDDMELRGVWNASGDRNGSSLSFSGGSLAPGKSVTFGYQISKSGRGNARPAGCSAVGGSCSVR